MQPGTLLMALLIAATLLVDAALVGAWSAPRGDADLPMLAFLAVQLQVATTAFVLWSGPWLLRTLLLSATLLIVTLVYSSGEQEIAWQEYLGAAMAYLMIGLIPLSLMRVVGVRFEVAAPRRQPNYGITIRSVLALMLIFALCFGISEAGSSTEMMVTGAILSSMVCATMLPLWLLLGENRKRRHWTVAALLLLCYLSATALFRRETVDDPFLDWLNVLVIRFHLPAILFATFFAWVLCCAGWRIVWPQRTHRGPALAVAPHTKVAAPSAATPTPAR